MDTVKESTSTKPSKNYPTKNNTVYCDKIDGLVDQYNNTKHSSVEMTPVEASEKKNEN